jgi:AraC-like DNA-binding protein
MAVIELLTDVVLTVTGFQLLLLAGVLGARLPAADQRRNLLMAFLLTKAFLILRWLVMRYEIVSAADWPGIYLTSCSVFFVLAPVLYLYVQGLCYRDFRVRPIHLIHLLPFASMFGFAVLGWFVAFAGGSTGSATFDRFIDDRFWNVFWCGNLIQILLYIVAMFRILRRYQRGLHDVHSFAEHIDLAWLRVLLLVISLHWVFVTARSTVGLLDLRVAALTGALDLFSISIFLVFTTALVVKGLAHVKHFPGIDEPVRTNGSPVSVEDLEPCAESLLAFMKTEQPHLDPFLSLEDLALRLSVPAWQLSRVLNTVFGRNFFLFVNGYRVEEAKIHLTDPAKSDRTMLRILHESGFNSKSTFNDAFKRETGMTPSEYRRRYSGDGIHEATFQVAACR